MLKIDYLPIAALKPYEKNARKHGRKSVDAIAASIREFGFNDPVGIWGNTIIEGHGRVLAAKKLGMTEVPCIRLDNLTDEQRRAYTLAHNKTAEVSEWDLDLADLEINDLPNFDFSEFGFDLVDEEVKHEQEAVRTQERVERILDLDRGQYAGVGYYDIPPLAPVTELPPIKEWIGFNFVLSDDNPEGKAVHFLSRTISSSAFGKARKSMSRNYGSMCALPRRTSRRIPICRLCVSFTTTTASIGWGLSYRRTA